MIKAWQVAVERSGRIVPGNDAAVSGTLSAEIVYLHWALQSFCHPLCELLVCGFLLSRSKAHTSKHIYSHAATCMMYVYTAM